MIHQFNVEEVVFVTVDGGIGTDLTGPPKAPALESVHLTTPLNT